MAGLWTTRQEGEMGKNIKIRVLGLPFLALLFLLKSSDTFFKEILSFLNSCMMGPSDADSFSLNCFNANSN